MAGNWLTGIDWYVTPGNGVYAGRRWVVKAPNNRRWESTTLDRNTLLAVCDRLRALGRCKLGEPTDEPLPAGVIPEGMVELRQRQCRWCTRTRDVSDFKGASRTCTGCARKNTDGPRSQIGDCPSCCEPCNYDGVRFVSALGKLACRACAAEHKPKDVERAPVIRSAASILAELTASPVAPSRRVDDHDFDCAMPAQMMW
jgi:hypothetical protein